MAYKPLFGQQIRYGADYNGEQWLDHPEILAKDLELMEKAHVNILSLGMFSWSMLEPEEGRYEFGWLDKFLDDFAARNIKVFLATPSGARPAWLSQKYPEVLRVNEMRQRALHGARHNHCMTSPIYREKVKAINTELAKRYAHHPAVIGWHISNEYSGFCHCPLCQAKFRAFLKEKYRTLENLNKQWWNIFWSHTYTDWEQIQSPSPIGENGVHALYLDWMRFTSQNALDFCKAEIETLRPFNPELPVTTNFMEYFYDYDYFEWAKHLDFISWDSYPQWHEFDDPERTAAYTAMNHDLMRSLKMQPFVLMEQTPSTTNWRPLSIQKRPGMNTLGSLQAVAHGADNIQYFQWRKSRGSSEKYHGAFVDHVGHLDTRVGREAVELGAKLEKLSAVAGSEVKADVAIIFDTQNRWLIDNIQGPRNKGMDYLGWCLDYYKPFWRRGINVDVIDETCSLDKYKVVLAPMTYMMRGDYAQRVEKFVKQGGIYLTSCWSGVANETDLCYLGGFPCEPLRQVLGIWEEELDCLDDNKFVAVRTVEKSSFFNEGAYQGSFLCGLAHTEGAQTLAVYDSEFYQGMPALTCNNYGAGKAYYAATRFDREFMDSLAARIEQEAGLKRALDVVLPEGVTAHTRNVNGENYIFVGNYGSRQAQLKLKRTYRDMLNGTELTGQIQLPPYASLVLTRID